MGNEKGILYLIPSLLGDAPVENSLPSYNIEIIRSIDEFIVEDLRSARRFLIKAKIEKPIDSLIFHLYNEHSKNADVASVMHGLMNGKNVGLISEAGCPSIADPGAEIIQFAHRNNIRVVPLVGPSSILMALISSGLNGQNFAFNGYLPKKEPDRIKALKQVETLAWQKNQTQIFIETPYRNDSLLKDILNACREETMLCVASDITLNSEFIKTQSIRDWKNSKRVFNDHPAVFLLGKNTR
ncbi:MAG TPA: SAM-dependent methyltransferase [Bacteroidia bacterium]|nr:SAM-dependent methyltransferase [Bacteroidia bacterium]